MSRLSTAFLATASAAAVTLAVIQVQFASTDPKAVEPIAQTTHEVAPSGPAHSGH